jgi:hypothetical protein
MGKNYIIICKSFFAESVNLLDLLTCNMILRHSSRKICIPVSMFESRRAHKLLMNLKKENAFTITFISPRFKWILHHLNIYVFPEVSLGGGGGGKA